MPTPSKPGHVTLVGCGPGDAELLTIKALRAIQAAQCVLYDNLVGNEILTFLPPSAEKIYVGKESSRHTLPQEEIIALMVKIAGGGTPLLRLKGGDGYIFGRGGEEAKGLKAAGIPFSVIPGISAVQGAAANFKIPLTFRDCARALTLVTGHLSMDRKLYLDWDMLARRDATIAVYMGIGTIEIICRELLAHGLAPDTPAAIIERATLPDERLLFAPLKNLANDALANGFAPPSLILVGQALKEHCAERFLGGF